MRVTISTTTEEFKPHSVSAEVPHDEADLPTLFNLFTMALRAMGYSESRLSEIISDADYRMVEEALQQHTDEEEIEMREEAKQIRRDIEELLSKPKKKKEQR